jgi:hypothetical protein
MQQQRPVNFIEGAEVIPEMQANGGAGSDNDPEEEEYYLDQYADLLKPEVRPNVTATQWPSVPTRPKPTSSPLPGDFLEGPGVIPEMQQGNNFLEGPEVIPEMASTSSTARPPTVTTTIKTTATTPTIRTTTTTAKRTTAVQSVGGQNNVVRPSYRPTVRPDLGYRPPSTLATPRPPEGPTTTSKYRPTIQPAIMATYKPTISFTGPKVRLTKNEKNGTGNKLRSH